jgi:hypothetical protein
MKPGDLIRNSRVERSEFQIPFSVFYGYNENWMGIVLSTDQPDESSRYTTVRVLLSDGRVHCTWLLDHEISEFVEVIS